VVIELRRRRIALAVGLSSGLVIALGVAAELASFLPAGTIRRDLLTLLSLSYEGNLPTWYASALLALCAGLLTLCAAGAREDRGRWWLLAAGFFYISFDETVGIHEAVDAMFENTAGIFYYGWVIPAGILVFALGLLYLPFVRRLPPRSRRRFVVAGILYVVGALVLELPLGLVTERLGADGLAYAAIDLVEESLELVGLSLFFTGLVDHLGGDAGRVEVRLQPATSAGAGDRRAERGAP
jgi:hypothetical protein